MVLNINGEPAGREVSVSKENGDRTVIVEDLGDRIQVRIFGKTSTRPMIVDIPMTGRLVVVEEEG